MKKRKDLELKNTKQELKDLLSVEDLDIKHDEKYQEQENKLNIETHISEDHYHGIHHFDKYGNHDDVSKNDFSLRAHFSRTKKSLTFRISMTALILALAIAMSAVDSLLEKFSINIGGVGFEMRILDLLVIIIGLPVVGLIGSILIAVIEPWFHFLIDSDHVPLQIALDSFGYVLTVVVFFLIFYLLFRNSPIHKDPNKKRNIFKTIAPSVLIVPILSIIFSGIFVLSLYVTWTTGDNDEWEEFIKSFSTIFFANLGVQIIRFSIMYILFVLVENKMKPINHRYH